MKYWLITAIILISCGAARAQTLSEGQNFPLSFRKPDVMVRQPWAPAPMSRSVQTKSNGPGVHYEDRDDLLPSSSMHLFALQTNNFGNFGKLLSPGNLLLAGVAGLNMERGLMGVSLPLGKSVSAFAAFKPLKTWSPSLIQNPSRKILSAGVELPLTESSKTGNNLLLRVSTGMDQQFSPSIFFTLTTNSFTR
jgi:hypothetical protein